MTPAELSAVFAELHRALKPGGLALLSFHLGDQTRHVSEMLGHTVDLDFQFFKRRAVELRLEAAGLTSTAYVERRPYPTEVATTRSYILARHPAVEE